MMSITVSKKRVVCPVCQRRGVGDWMGEVQYSEGSPETWHWIRKPKRGVFGAKPSVDVDPKNPTGVVFRGGFHNKNEWSVVRSQDGDTWPRCFDGHKLAVLQPATMTDLLRKADAVGREWIAIPE